VICHGGPISEPNYLEYILARTRGIAGFFGASSIERLATEKAIEDLVIAFKQVKIAR
jgi:predicted TIM-barrel enzyme